MSHPMFRGAPRVLALLERQAQDADGKPPNCVRDVRPRESRSAARLHHRDEAVIVPSQGHD